ncbi:MAG TPA: M23 family metallopeptidase, partial [Roseiflexaceae bacterium]
MSSSRPLRPRGLWRTLPALWLAAGTTAATATSIAPAFAEQGQPHSASSRSQRALADDFSVDQVLVAPRTEGPGAGQLTQAGPASTASTAATDSTAATAATTTTDSTAATDSTADITAPAASAAATTDAASTSPAAPTTNAAGPSAPSPAAAEAEADQQMASLGPAMRRLHPLFAPVWPSMGEITTYFGEVGPYAPRGHAGLDIAADTGTPILAADEGEVLKAYWNEDGYGGLIVIEHPSGYETWYAHLSRLGVEKGEHVSRGETIGRMGSTGYSTGSHLHFEVRQEGELRDPLKFLAESALKRAN